MKAVLLAAGKGERLGAVTRAVPKPMIEVGGKPVLQHNVEMCVRAGVTELFINLHHLPEAVRDHFGDGSRWGARITYAVEDPILGTSGAVRNFAPHLRDGAFFVVYGDNLSGYELGAISGPHRAHGADMSVALFEKEDVRQSGVALLDPAGPAADAAWIRGFVEKPSDPSSVPSRWVNAGIYLLEPGLIDAIPAGFSDFGKEIIPGYLGAGRRILGVKMDRPVVAIDTPELLESARG